MKYLSLIIIIRNLCSLKHTTLISLTLICVSCASLSQSYRLSLDHSRVEGNLVGPYMPIRAISPTEILATVVDGNTRKEVVLKLRGVATPPSKIDRYEAERWLRREVVSYEDEGLYLLKDTILESESSQITGVVLYPLQRAVFNNIDTGEAITRVSRYAILQVDALDFGILLHEKDAGDFSWDRDFAHFQRGAQRDRRGYWEKDGNSGANGQMGSNVENRATH